MRVMLLAGLALVIAGSVLLYRGGTFTSRRDVLKVGDLKVTAEEQHPIQPWIAGAVVVAGVALIVSGARRKS
jgi:hypothetical protein